MRGRWLNRGAWLVAGALLIGSCSPRTTPTGARAAAVPPASVAMDKDGNLIFDSLDRQLAAAKADERLPVLVLLQGEQHRSAFEAAVKALPGAPSITQRYQSIPAYALNATPAQVKALAQLDGVAQVERDAEVRLHLDGARDWFGVAKARADFNLSGSWDGYPTRYSKDDIVVAVIDTGIAVSHRDLNEGKVIGWKDVVNGRSEPYDDHGHGTHVASIVAGQGDGNPNYVGVAPGAALVGVKVMDAQGNGTLSNILAGIDWVIANKSRYGIRVFNISFGTDERSDGTDTLSQAVDNAVSNGLVAVVSAGNDGPVHSIIGSPAAALKAITVGAMADVSEGGFYLAPFSSRGPGRYGVIKPDLVAPGVRITAARAGTWGEYIAYNGTSMAAPFVAGTVALMLDAKPSLTPAQVADLLRQTAIDWGASGPDMDFGYGRLDAYEALKAAGSRSGTGPAVPDHLHIRGDLPDGTYEVEHTFTVASLRYPLAVSMIMPDWGGPGAPNLDLYLYGPDGRQLASSVTRERQETVAGRLPDTGTYRVVVRAPGRDGGLYDLDISADLERADDKIPQARILQPADGATLRGRVEIQVEALDDVKVQKVELSLAAGKWLDITDAYDGVYSYLWDTAQERDGTREIKVRVTDSAGQERYALSQVSTRNDSPRYQEKVMQGPVSAVAPDAWEFVKAHATGWVDLTLSWDGEGDLDMEIYSPSNQLIERVFTMRRPETVRIDTAHWGTGAYWVKIKHHSGGEVNYTLRASAITRQNPSSHWLGPDQPVIRYLKPVHYTGPGKLRLTWQGDSDLDLFVYDPEGRLRARAFTLNQPEKTWVDWDQTGEWVVELRLSRLEDGKSGVNGSLQQWAPAQDLS